MEKLTTKTASQLFRGKMEVGEGKKYNELVNMLKENFEDVNSNKCAGVIHRNMHNNGGYLRKSGSYYIMLSKDEHRRINHGIGKVHRIIDETLKEIKNISPDEFSDEDFDEYLEVMKELKSMYDISKVD